MEGVTSSWDLKLFREAQILAAEDAEDALKGLPEVKNTKYIEVCRRTTLPLQDAPLTSDLYEKSLDIPLFYRLGVMKWKFGTRAPTQKSSPVSQRFSSANSASNT